MAENDAGVTQAGSYRHPLSWVRGTADGGAEPAAGQAGESGEAPGLPLDARTPEEKRISALEERIAGLEFLMDLLLEATHDMVNDLHAPKARFERKMLGMWKKHIEKKKASSV